MVRTAHKSCSWTEFEDETSKPDMPKILSLRDGSGQGSIISSMTKARRYGFHEAVDTEEMFFRMFDELRASKVIS